MLREHVFSQQKPVDVLVCKMLDPTSELRVWAYTLYLSFQNKPSKCHYCEFIVLALSYSFTIYHLFIFFIKHSDWIMRIKQAVTKFRDKLCTLDAVLDEVMAND